MIVSHNEYVRKEVITTHETDLNVYNYFKMEELRKRIYPVGDAYSTYDFSVKPATYKVHESILRDKDELAKLDKDIEAGKPTDLIRKHLLYNNQEIRDKILANKELKAKLADDITLKATMYELSRTEPEFYMYYDIVGLRKQLGIDNFDEKRSIITGKDKPPEPVIDPKIIQMGQIDTTKMEKLNKTIDKASGTNDDNLAYLENEFKQKENKEAEKQKRFEIRQHYLEKFNKKMDEQYEKDDLFAGIPTTGKKEEKQEEEEEKAEIVAIDETPQDENTPISQLKIPEQPSQEEVQQDENTPISQLKIPEQPTEEEIHIEQPQEEIIPEEPQPEEIIPEEPQHEEIITEETPVEQPQEEIPSEGTPVEEIPVDKESCTRIIKSIISRYYNRDFYK